jgi:hypothetical protein
MGYGRWAVAGAPGEARVGARRFSMLCSRCVVKANASALRRHEKPQQTTCAVSLILYVYSLIAMCYVLCQYVRNEVCGVLSLSGA